MLVIAVARQRIKLDIFSRKRVILSRPFDPEIIGLCLRVRFSVLPSQLNTVPCHVLMFWSQF